MNTKGEKMEVKNLPAELRGVICAIEYQTIADLVGKAADEIERLRAEIADAHALAYNSLPDRGNMEDTLCGQVNKLREEIKRLTGENEARYALIELFLQAAGIEPLNGESVPEQIVRAIHRVEEMRKLRYPYPIDLFRENIRAAGAAREK